jgi:hypothetical protein
MNATMNAVKDRVNELVEAVLQKTGSLAFAVGEEFAVRQTIQRAIADGCNDDDAVWIACVALGF